MNHVTYDANLIYGIVKNKTEVKDYCVNVLWGIRYLNLKIWRELDIYGHWNKPTIIDIVDVNYSNVVDFEIIKVAYKHVIRIKG